MTIDVNRLLLILIILSTFALGTFVQLKDRRNAVNTSFNIMTITIILWSFCVFMILTVWKHSNPILWVRASYSIGTLMTTSFVVFSLIFCYGELRPVRKLIIGLIPLCIIMAIISMTDYSVVSIDYENGEIKKVVYGFGNIIWGIYVISCLMIIQFNLITKWKKGNRIARLKVKYMYLGIAVTTTFMLLSNIVLPFMGYEKAIGYGPVSITIMLGCIAYAIVKHRLMDIKVFIRKGIVYSALMAVASAIMALIIIGIPKAFPELSRIQIFAVSILSGASVVFFIRPLSQSMKELMNTFIFKEQYYSQMVLSDYASSAAKTLDMEEISELTFKAITETMKVEKAEMWLFDTNMGLFVLVQSLGMKPEELRRTFSPRTAIISHLEESHEPLVREELEKSLPMDVYDRIKDEFNTSKAEIIIPLFVEEKLIGFLNMGGKSSGALYFSEDIAFIKAITAQATIAIQNAKLHQKVVDMEKLSLLGRLSAELAHEIKNPLVTIKTAFEFLVNHESGDGMTREINDDFKGFLNLAMRETDRINNLIRQLLYLGRPSPPKLAWCDMNQIINDTVLLLKHSISENSIEIVDARENCPIEVYADGDRLKQVFLNIGQNAIDAMKNGGKLTFELELKSDPDKMFQSSDKHATKQDAKATSRNTVFVRISDTGKGMSEDELKDIFEPFYTKKLTGTGLGLAIVRSIIREHNGTIDVKSNQEEGTTFTIEIPQIHQTIETAVV